MFVKLQTSAVGTGARLSRWPPFKKWSNLLSSGLGYPPRAQKVGAGETALRPFYVLAQAGSFRSGKMSSDNAVAHPLRHGDAALSKRSCKAMNTLVCAATPRPKSSTNRQACSTHFAARYMISCNTVFSLLRLAGSVSYTHLTLPTNREV